MATAEDAALGVVEHNWGTAYDITVDPDGKPRAWRKDRRGGVITADTADELGLLVQADYRADPVPRDLPGQM